MYTCYKRSKKNIAEALKPVVEFCKETMSDKAAVRDFYSLLRAAIPWSQANRAADPPQHHE
jgi:hypothetical protein